jgi:hypothetical protein
MTQQAAHESDDGESPLGAGFDFKPAPGCAADVTTRVVFGDEALPAATFDLFPRSGAVRLKAQRRQHEPGPGDRVLERRTPVTQRSVAKIAGASPE